MLDNKLISDLNEAIPVNIETFRECEELGGKVITKNDPSKNHSGIFHVIEYKGTLYVARTDDYI